MKYLKIFIQVLINRFARLTIGLYNNHNVDVRKHERRILI